LQSILNEQGYAGTDLARQVDALLNESDASRALGQSLRTIVDGVRHFGNFSAHPINDRTTLQVIPVETHEAEWCLEIVRELFDHFYIAPEKAAQRKAALNTKLATAGKPPSKG